MGEGGADSGAGVVAVADTEPLQRAERDRRREGERAREDIIRGIPGKVMQ